MSDALVAYLPDWQLAGLAVAFALVSLGNLDTAEFTPLRYLMNTLNVRSYQGVALAYLTELARDLKAPGAKREPDRDFFLTRGRSST